MSEYRNHIKQYNAADIQRYLDGKMNAAEMHAIEKAALEDPFLADAIEGFDLTKQEYDNDTINNDLVQLRNQIAEKTNTGKVRAIGSFRWWRVAAAAIVLIVFGAVTYNLWLNPDKNEQLSVISDKKPATIEPGATTKETIRQQDETLLKKDDSGSDGLVKQPRVEPEKKLNNPIAKAADREIASAPPAALKENNQTASNFNKTADAEDFTTAKLDKFKNKNDSISIDSPLARSQKFVEYEPQRKVDVTNNDVVIVNPDKKAKSKSPGRVDAGLTKGSTGFSNASLNYFNGRVTDNNNRPIANATVQLTNTRNGYTTDQYGNFRIPSTDSSVNVTISGVGFGTQTLHLRNDLAINYIQLQPSSIALNEVVVTKPSGNAKREKSNYKTKYPSVLIQDAEPANGWIEYDKYIESNKKVNPDDPNVKTGEVVVSFQVNRKSELSDFKIEQKLSPSQDAEAIRLI